MLKKISQIMASIPHAQIHDQCYHLLGSLLPLPDEPHKFMQLFFMGNTDEEAKQQCKGASGLRAEVVTALQNMPIEHHIYVNLFKYALEKMQQEPKHKVINRPDKKYTREHAG